MRNIITKLICTISAAALSVSVFSACTKGQSSVSSTESAASAVTEAPAEEDAISSYSTAFCIVNNNKPFFFESEITAEPYQRYSELDSLGRCGAAMAVIGKETMPTEERGKIGNIRPTGWHMAKYDIVEGKYLYNRCHLIGYQLSGENDNRQNLITGTRFMNVVGMLPFENKVTDFVTATGLHVLYRATPKFDKDNLLADGVLLEARSVEDGGAGLGFCVFCYNIQPGITIDYMTGDSKLYDGTPILPPEEEHTESSDTDSSIPELPAETETQPADTEQPSTVLPEDSAADSSKVANDEEKREYIVNKGTRRFHLPECPSCEEIKEKNKYAFFGTKQELMENGYLPCQRCNP